MHILDNRRTLLRVTGKKSLNIPTIHVCHTSLIFMSKLSNAIGANSASRYLYNIRADSDRRRGECCQTSFEDTDIVRVLLPNRVWNSCGLCIMLTRRDATRSGAWRTDIRLRCCMRLRSTCQTTPQRPETKRQNRRCIQARHNTRRHDLRDKCRVTCHVERIHELFLVSQNIIQFRFYHRLTETIIYVKTDQLFEVCPETC